MSTTLTFQLGNYLLRNRTETTVLPYLSVGLALSRGIDFTRQEPLRLLSLAAGVCKRNGWIGTECQRLLFAREPVGQPPQFAAVRLDQ